MREGPAIRSRRLQNHGYVFILPTLVFFTVFLIYPMVSAFRLSLFDWNLLTPEKFVGLKNFATMVSDPRVINSYVRTLHFSGISVAAINVLAFVFALMFSSRLIRLKNFLQSLVFLPVILSVVAVGVVWEFMYQSTGLISDHHRGRSSGRAPPGSRRRARPRTR